MLGLYGTLNLGTRALQTHSQGLAIAGQNLANVNNPAYTRQRLQLQTSATISTPDGPQGTGVTSAGIQRIHDSLLDRQIQNETSVSGFWNAQQGALRSTQWSLGEALNSSTQGASGTGGTNAAASSTLGTDLTGLFNEFHTLAASPASLPNRQVLLAKAQNLAAQFNEVDQRLAGVHATLNETVTQGVGEANELLTSIAHLNEQIRRSEAGGTGSANDLRDSRQQKLEALAELTNFESVEDSDGQVNITVGGELLVSGRQVLTPLVANDPGTGRVMVQTGTGVALGLTGGSLQGTIDARDGALASSRSELDTLAKTLATEVNTLHRSGFNLQGGTNADFFTGTTAADLAVNAALLGNPSLIQASGNATAAGDNQVALALGRLAEQPQAALGGRTFAAAYAHNITGVSQTLANANTQVEDQALLAGLLQGRRSSISGVSIDEEMTDLMKYQKAFQASARIVSVVDQLLDEILSLKR